MTPEIITKQFKRGMTVEQIATLHGLNVNQVEGITKDVSVEREVKTPMSENIAKTRRTKPRISIDLVRVEELLREGVTLPKVAKELNVKYATLRARVDENAELRELASEASSKAKSRSMSEMKAAKQETAVTTEAEGFSENYTIAHLSKEEPSMTEAIVEAKQHLDQDKWVHFIVSQIAAAKVKAKFDLVEKDGKIVKQTEVRFLIEEELA